MSCDLFATSEFCFVDKVSDHGTRKMLLEFQGLISRGSDVLVGSFDVSQKQIAVIAVGVYVAL